MQLFPLKKKDYIKVNRLLNIKQTLFIFLLQKKEDKHIEFASSGLADSRTIDWKVSSVQDPKPSVLYAGAFLGAIALSAAVIALKMLLNKRIETSKEIYQATTLPIAGEIAFAGKLENEIVVTQDNVSPVAEQFRTLRTNLFYLSQAMSNKIMLVTSAISGEGKSFISLNLANAIAISGRKTILLEFDLRNPGLLNQVENKNTLELLISFQKI